MTSVGAFVRDTLKPLVEELDVLLGKCEHLKLSKDEIDKFLRIVIGMEYLKLRYNFWLYLILGVLFCLTVYFILR